MYKITIEQTNMEVKDVKEWHKIHDKENFDSKEDPQYAYVIKKDTEVRTAREIYTQQVDNLNLKKVIEAINT